MAQFREREAIVKENAQAEREEFLKIIEKQQREEAEERRQKEAKLLAARQNQEGVRQQMA